MDQHHFNAAVDFGRILVESGDLDPVYIAIAGADLPLRQRKRLVLAYSCLYNLPLAGAMSEQAGDSFWYMLLNAANNVGGGYPRGTERRHWRGEAAITSASDLMNRGKLPEAIVDDWFQGSLVGLRPTFQEVQRRVRSYNGFGPWIAFKVADLGERILEVPVDFKDCVMGLYRDPAQGAALLLFGTPDHTLLSNTLGAETVLQALLSAPALRNLVPRPGTRKLNVQEAETILCKYKSHCKDHYPIGKDSYEVRQALLSTKFPSKTGTKLRLALERGINWKILEEYLA